MPTDFRLHGGTPTIVFLLTGRFPRYYPRSDRLQKQPLCTLFLNPPAPLIIWEVWTEKVDLEPRLHADMLSSEVLDLTQCYIDERWFEGVYQQLQGRP